MTAVVPGRRRADPAEDVVVFLIGMRINRLRDPRSWGPVVAAMPRMLRELNRHPELGLLGARTYVSGRTILVVQYWRSAAALQAYARSADHEHLPAWRELNRRMRSSNSVGIFHETYVVPAASTESVYRHMPEMGLAAATRSMALVGD